MIIREICLLPREKAAIPRGRQEPPLCSSSKLADGGGHWGRGVRSSIPLLLLDSALHISLNSGLFCVHGFEISFCFLIYRSAKGFFVVGSLRVDFCERRLIARERCREVLDQTLAAMLAAMLPFFVRQPTPRAAGCTTHHAGFLPHFVLMIPGLGEVLVLFSDLCSSLSSKRFQSWPHSWAAQLGCTAGLQSWVPS